MDVGGDIFQSDDVKHARIATKAAAAAIAAISRRNAFLAIARVIRIQCTIVERKCFSINALEAECLVARFCERGWRIAEHTIRTYTNIPNVDSVSFGQFNSFHTKYFAYHSRRLGPAHQCPR